MPTIDTMQAHEARLTILEEQTREIRSALKDLAQDMRRLADATVQQAEDRQALKRAFDQIEKMSARMDAIDQRIDDAEKARLQSVAHKAERELEKQREDKKRFFWMVVSYGLSAGFGAVLAHFGIQVLK